MEKIILIFAAVLAVSVAVPVPEANPEAEPTFFKRVVYYPTYRHYWKRSADAEPAANPAAGPRGEEERKWSTPPSSHFGSSVYYPSYSSRYNPSYSYGYNPSYSYGHYWKRSADAEPEANAAAHPEAGSGFFTSRDYVPGGFNGYGSYYWN